MARRRAAQGAYHYRPRTASSAFPKKRAPSPTSKAGRRQERAADRRAGKLPKPGSAAASRLRNRFLPATEEVAFLKRASLTETLSGGDRAEWSAELDKIADAEYRKAYNAQHRERQATKPKKKPSRVRVRAHWRRIGKR